MIKVFLVEDESIMREGLRDNIPWQQCGYEFVGEASDGEMALPLIRKLVPDVLITDIKMPFMDGLELSELVSREFPNIKVIIISGYDEFEYARRAIHVGVEQYLLKPITRSTMQKVLMEIREKIESEQAQKDYLEKFRQENHEYEQFSRRHFFERVFEGNMSAQQIYSEAHDISLELNASSYNLVLFSISDKMKSGNPLSISAAEYIENIQRYFLKFSEYIVFRWNINSYGIMIMGEETVSENDKGDGNSIDALTDRCVSYIRRTLEDAEGNYIEWYVSVGTPVTRISFLADCFKDVNRIFSHRFLLSGEHILTGEAVSRFSSDDAANGNYQNMDLSKVDPEILKNFLTKGQKDEADDFVTSYIANLSEPIKSKIFRDYLILNIRFSVLSYVESLGKNQDEFLNMIGSMEIEEKDLSADNIRSYVLSLLMAALEVRDEQTDTQGKNIIKDALNYIEDNFTNESLSLNEVAAATGVSPTYFSGIFSAEMNQTFIEYVTSKRMEKAKKLLKTTDKHTRDIGPLVGYKDSHYFSFVFKKTQGMTPREYRNNTNKE